MRYAGSLGEVLTADWNPCPLDPAPTMEALQHMACNVSLPARPEEMPLLQRIDELIRRRKQAVCRCKRDYDGFAEESCLTAERATYSKQIAAARERHRLYCEHPPPPPPPPTAVTSPTPPAPISTIYTPTIYTALPPPPPPPPPPPVVPPAPVLPTIYNPPPLPPTPEHNYVPTSPAPTQASAGGFSAGGLQLAALVIGGGYAAWKLTRKKKAGQ